MRSNSSQSNWHVQKTKLSTVYQFQIKWANVESMSLRYEEKKREIYMDPWTSCWISWWYIAFPLGKCKSYYIIHTHLCMYVFLFQVNSRFCFRFFFWKITTQLHLFNICTKRLRFQFAPNHNIPKHTQLKQKFKCHIQFYALNDIDGFHSNVPHAYR